MSVPTPVMLMLVALSPPQQEEVDVVARHCLVERHLQLLAGHRRLYEMRRHYDDKVGLGFLVGRTAE